MMVKRNELLAEQRIKTRLTNYCPNISLGIKFMNTETSKTSKPQKFGLSLPQRLDLKNSDKYVAFQNLSIYYTWKNIRQQYKNNKLKVIAPTKNDELELSDDSYSVSHIQDCIKYITKKHETLTTNLPIHIYINKTINRLMFKNKSWIYIIW